MMATSLILLLSLSLMVRELTGSITYSACRPTNGIDYAFDLKCNQTQLTWIQYAFFGAVTDGGALSNFCEKPAPNRTRECIPDRNLNTRNLRLACNTIRGQCQPNQRDAVMNPDTFKSCNSSTGFTYGYAIYDCLPAFDSNGGSINFVYLGSSSDVLSGNFSDKVYLMSTNYDNQGYTYSPMNHCSVTVAAGTSLHLRVLDLRGQTMDGSFTNCSYTLSINNGNGYAKEWCAQSDWDFFEDYNISVSAGNNGLTMDITFSSSQSSNSGQGRVWILVEASRTDGSSANILTSCGSTPSTTTATTTTTMTTTSTTPTSTSTFTTTTPTTTSTSPTTTTTTPSTTSTTTSTTTTITPATTSTTTPTSTPKTTKTTISTSTTPSTTTSTTTTTTPTPTSNTTTTTTATTITMSTPSSASSTTTTFTKTTSATTSISTTIPITTSATLPTLRFSTTTSSAINQTIPIQPQTITTTMTTIPVEPVSLNSPDYPVNTTTGSGLTSSTEMSYVAKEAASTYNVVGLAIGVSVAGLVVLCVVVAAIVCICIIFRKRKKQRSSSPTGQGSTGQGLSSQYLSSLGTSPLHTISSTIPNPGSQSPGVVSTTSSGIASEEETYAQIDDTIIGVTITRKGPVKRNDQSSVKHQFSVQYTVGSPKTSTENKKPKPVKYGRVKKRPPEMDVESSWDRPPEYPPPISDKKVEQLARDEKKSEKMRLSKLYIPPGNGTESDTDIQENPLFEMAARNVNIDEG